MQTNAKVESVLKFRPLNSLKITYKGIALSLQENQRVNQQKINCPPMGFAVTLSNKMNIKESENTEK